MSMSQGAGIKPGSADEPARGHALREFAAEPLVALAQITRVLLIGLWAAVSVAALIIAAVAHASPATLRARSGVHGGGSAHGGGSVHGVEVHAVRLWASPESTRLVLDLSGSASHSLKVLHNPERIELEVAHAHLKRGVREPPAGAGLVKAVRVGSSSPRELRFVIDLERASRATSFLSRPNDRYGYRLVVDLGAPSEAAPVRAAHVRPAARDR